MSNVCSMTRRIARLTTTALVAGGMGMAALGLTAATAHADGGPHRWCPGEPLPPTGNHVTNPVIWDNNVCHTYYYVYFGQGNVAQNIWDGDNPPPPPPPAPPALINKDNCQQILGMFCPH